MKSDTVIILLLALAVLALIIYKHDPLALITEGPDEPEHPEAEGPTYLVYNAPWGFAPPNCNVLPRIAREIA